MEQRRLIYTSLGNHRENKNEAKISKRRRKIISNQSNIDKAARAYLQDPKLLPRQNINSLIKTSRNVAEKGSFILKRLEEELQRRDVEKQFLSKRKLPLKPQVQHDSQQPRNILNKSPRQKKQSKKRKQTYTFKLSMPKLSIEQIYRSGQKKTARYLVRAEKVTSMEKIESPHHQSYTKISKSYLEAVRRVTEVKKIENGLEKPEEKKNMKSESSEASLKSSRSALEGQKKLIVRNLRTFVVNQKDELISKYLLLQGWRQSNICSDRYTLKWSYNDNYRDFEIVLHANKKHRKPAHFYNHIKNNKLVKKNQFNELVRQMGCQNIDGGSFIPQTFLIHEEKEEFIEDYQRRVLVILMAKHYSYLQQKGLLLKSNQISELSLNEKARSIVDFFIRLNETDKEPESLIEKAQSEQAVVHLSILFYLLVFSCNIWICLEGEQADKFDEIYGPVVKDKTIMALLISLNRVELTFQEYLKNQHSSPLRKKGAVQLKISVINGYIKTTKSFLTPSRKLIEGVAIFHTYFMRKFQDYSASGSLNLWIIKPCSGSKGCGIQIIDKPEKINQILDANNNQKLIQKYIENIWVLTPSLVGPHQHLKKSSLFNHKFDIRQWVLLVPPKSYIFSSFYIRICSREYNLQELSCLKGHLSNYSINKQNFALADDSVMSENEFQAILQVLGIQEKYISLKQQLKKRISQLVNEALEQCDFIKGTFEIVGFDIIIDQNFKPWILQCNMSPACSMRSDWLREMKECMANGALEIILSPALYQKSQQGKVYKWEELSICQTTSNQSLGKQNLLVLGMKMKQNQTRGKAQVFTDPVK